MKFGTLQSITKEPSTEIADDENEFQFDAGADDTTDSDDFSFGDDSELDMGDATEFEDEMETPVIQKLLTLKREIDEILSDMGYSDDSGFEGLDSLAGEDGPEQPDDESEFEFSDSEHGDESGEFEEDEFAGTEFGEPEEENAFPGEEEGLDAPPEEVDPDFQGDIRTVKGANLVYKRKQEDGNFDEMWIFNVGKDIRTETQIRKAILAGTDIVPSQRESEDGVQHCDTYTVGNVQYLVIHGLPN